MYYNVHTHLDKKDEEVIFVKNIHENFDRPLVGKVSMGLHPWYLSPATYANDLENLQKNLIRPEVLAVGECGLDKLCSTDWNLQLTAFQAQVKLSEKANKPLVIHCVKAFQEILQEIKNVTVPVIFHGVNNKLSVIQSVIDSGHYLSFGKSLLGFNEAILHTFRVTPLERILLETDDSEVSIREIYKSAARIKDIDEKDLVLQLEKNFLDVFQP